MTGIFLSHSSIDKPFARRLGNDLRQFGAKVWIDEAEIKIGDSLIDKISEGLEKTDYLVVLLSAASCASVWVKREVNIAITKEIQGKKVMVLPCLIEECKIPAFLIDKKYANFTDNSKYVKARSELISTIGLEEKSESSLFLDQHVFYDLEDLNDGFDADSIRYFSKLDFEKVLERVSFFNIEIYGIEPWPNKEFYDVDVADSYNLSPDDPNWYMAAFNKFVNEGVESYFSASYGVPEDVLNKFR